MSGGLMMKGAGAGRGAGTGAGTATRTSTGTPTLRAAAAPRRHAGDARMLVVDRVSRSISHEVVTSLPAHLEAGDLVVVNDAATVPASLAVTTDDGAAVEVRLVSRLLPDAAGPVPAGSRWTAVLLGAGSFRDDTDLRPPPPLLAEGARLSTKGGLRLRIIGVHTTSRRLVDIEFDRRGPALFRALYAAGEPIRYSYLGRPVPLRRFQTAFASRPWAVEMPSAAQSLTAGVLIALRRRGVAIASLTHAAGISATGDAQLDALLPFPERYRLPHDTVAATRDAARRGGRVIAVGTTVVRALEGNSVAHRGRLTPGEHTTDLRITPRHSLGVVDGLFTNVHAPGESHHDLMRAFADDPLLARAHREAHSAGYLAHEFGDATLIL